MAAGDAMDLIAGMRTHRSTSWSAWDLVRCPADHLAQALAAHGSPLSWADRLTRPFRMSDCTDEKIADSLGWIHTHLSSAAARGGRQAIDLFTAFALLLKADDYYLARKATPNVSVTIQRRIIAALAPRALLEDQQRTTRANAAALWLVQHLDPRDDVLRACLLSTFAGTTWFGDWLDGRDPASIGGGIGSVIAGSYRWGADSRDEFAASVPGARRMVAILDDSGEAVFDLALLQALLVDNPGLDLTIMAHRQANGVNVTAREIGALLHERYFAGLEERRRMGWLRFWQWIRTCPHSSQSSFRPCNGMLSRMPTSCWSRGPVSTRPQPWAGQHSIVLLSIVSPAAVLLTIRPGLACSSVPISRCLSQARYEGRPCRE